MLNEREVLHNIRLSDIQKEVLAKTIAAPNEDVAGDEILDGGRNYVGAKNILVRLGLMTFHDNQAAITQTGHEVMRRANLIDETGQLTDEGQKLAYSDEEDDQQQQGQQQPGQQQQGAGWGDDQQQQVDQGPLPGTGPSFGESFSLIRSVHEQLQFEKQLKRFTESNMQRHYSDDPKEQTVYENGFEAGLIDAGRHHNPHDSTAQARLFKAWQDGYEDGWEY